MISVPKLHSIGCAGRITQFAETGDGRYLVTLTGIARFRVVDELPAVTPYRQCRVDFGPFSRDFEARAGEDQVDRDGVIRTLKLFVEANELRIDWKGIREASNEALVNALSMMSPFEPREKQALLEAPDLKTRAEILIAITEMELARGGRLRRAAAIGPGSIRCRRHRGHARTGSAASARRRRRIDPKLLEILVCPLTRRRSNTTRRARN